MTKLHLISKPFNLKQFEIDSKRMINKNDEILFIGDAVINLMDKNILLCIEQSKLQYFVLSADSICRGINLLMNQKIKQISDSEMVELTLKHQQVISW